jgi:hypothetical protein
VLELARDIGLETARRRLLNLPESHNPNVQPAPAGPLIGRVIPPQSPPPLPTRKRG